MNLLPLFLIVLSVPALGCMGNDGPKELREDIERQAQITKELAEPADLVFIGEVLSVTESLNSARIRILEPLKGESEADVVELQNEARTVRVACDAWRMFKNIYLQPGQEYVIYSSNGQLLRTGRMERIDWDISVDREISIVKRAADNT